MTPEESTGERVHRLRRKARMTQAELAAAMSGHGWHPTTVARTEDNERVLRLPEAKTLALIFSLDKVDDLVSEAS